MPHREVAVESGDFLKFLEKKPVSENLTLKDLLDAPQEVREGAFGCHWKSLLEDRLPLLSLGRLSGSWGTLRLTTGLAWMQYGGAVCSSEEGHVFFEGSPGVDVRCDRTWFNDSRI